MIGKRSGFAGWPLVGALGAAVAAALTLAALGPESALADVGPPVHVQVSEREPGLYAVSWRVPKALPARAVPVPQFPEICAPAGETTVTEQPNAWLLTREWRCDGTLAGQSLGMRYPFPDLAVNTVVRVNLLSGDRFAHVLTPGEGPWQLPAGRATVDRLRGARNAVLAGVAHVTGSWVHAAFILALVLLGGTGTVVRVVSAFTIGQVGAVAAGAVLGLALPPRPAEIGLALAIGLLARQALGTPEGRQRLAALSTAAGVVHGLGVAGFTVGTLGDAAPAVGMQILAVLGMDAAHLVGASVLMALAAWVARSLRSPARDRLQRLVAYAAGSVAFALAFGLALGGDVGRADAAAAPNPVGATAAGLVTSPSSATAGSRRVAPATPDAAIQSFLSVEPFEVRHEVMVRLAGLADALAIDPGSRLEIEAQPGVVERITALVLASSAMRADGTAPDALVRRADFMTVDPTGARPRPSPVPESVPHAVVGLVIAYPLDGMPDQISLTWTPMPAGLESIPVSVIDPESAASSVVDASRPTVTWENALVEDPIPTVEAVAVEPLRLPVPLLSLPLLVLSAALLIGWARGRRSAIAMAAARVALALAFLAGPVVRPAVALPGSAGRVPSESQAERVMAGLLPNVYRALEFREEGLIYDRLAVSVTGETLTETYLEQRRGLQIEERGGAQARVETVEVLGAAEIEAREPGFEARVTWTVGGMVTHFGHRHFRQNRYDARIAVVPVAGSWKIRSIEVLDQERLR